MMRFLLFLLLSAMTLSCASSDRNDRLASSNDFSETELAHIRYCLEIQAGLGSPLIDQKSLKIKGDSIRLVSVTRTPKLSLVTVSFEVDKPYPGAPSMICNINQNDGLVLNASYWLDEVNSKHMKSSQDDIFSNYSDEELETIVHSSTTRVAPLDSELFIKFNSMLDRVRQN